jgi:hypothetical protein
VLYQRECSRDLRSGGSGVNASLGAVIADVVRTRAILTVHFADALADETTVSDLGAHRRAFKQ